MKHYFKKFKISTNLKNNLIQFIFIFSSVYFALWLSNKNEESKLANMEITAIKSLHNELGDNLNELDSAIKYHQIVFNQIIIYSDSIKKGQLDPSAQKPYTHIQHLFSRKSNSLGLPNLKANAFEMLKNSEAYVKLDYNLASSISNLYYIQNTGVESTSKEIINALFKDKSLFNLEDSEATIYLTQIYVREILGQEKYLKNLIKNTLIELENEYDSRINF